MGQIVVGIDGGGTRTRVMAADEVAIGIRVVGGHFTKGWIEVSFIGSVVRSPYMRAATTACLETSQQGHRYRVVEPQFSSQGARC